MNDAREHPRLTIDRVPEAINALEFAVKEFERERAPSPVHGRLQQHIRMLREIEGATCYPADPSTRARIATAMGDAAQFSWIASVLPDSPVSTFLADVKRALNGSQVRRSDESAQPYQFQSQLYFGAMLASSGHRIAVKDGDGLPDFFAPNGSLPHPIEVKRPTSRVKIRRNLTIAADQIHAAGSRGLLVIDLSDVLQSSSDGLLEGPGQPDPWRDRFEAPFQAEKLNVARLIHGGIGTSAPMPRFRSVAAYCVFASGWLWSSSVETPTGWPEYRAFFYCRRVYSTRHSLTYHRGTRLRDMVERALRRFVGGLEITAAD